MNRLEKMEAIATNNGVQANIKELGGMTYANINGVSFRVRGLASFDAKCRELKTYVKPAPIELTSRIERIERNAIANV
jgi:hypothetical protein